EHRLQLLKEAAKAATDEQPGARVQARVLLEGHDDGPDHRVADHDEQHDDGRENEVEAEPVLRALELRTAPSAPLRGLAGLGVAGAGLRGDGHWASRRVARSGTSGGGLGERMRWGRGSCPGPTARDQPPCPAAWIAACMSLHACCTPLDRKS